jgi:ubiquitin-protein ligase
MSIVRLKRLQADHQKLQDYVRRHPRVRLVQADGNPPERYQLRFQVKSLRQADDGLVEADEHLVEVSLPRNYPRVPPQCRMLTPVFHPNIAPHAICIGDHWTAGESLPSIVARIGEMLAYQSYNTKSPLNGEAARWADGHAAELPLDPVSLVPDEAAPPPDLGPAAEFEQSIPMVMAAPEEDDVPMVKPVDEPPPPVVVGGRLPCPSCGAALKVPPEALGRTARCPQCRAPVQVPAIMADPAP